MLRTLLSILFGAVIGIVITMTFVFLDLQELSLPFTKENFIVVFQSQNIYRFSTLFFPLFFSFTFYLYIKMLDSKKALKSQHQFFVEILNSLDDIVFVFNSNGEIIYKNESINTLKKSDKNTVSEMLSMSLEDILEVKGSKEIHLIKKKSTIEAFILSLTNFSSENKFVISLKNVQELKDKERLLSIQKARMNEAAKLSAMGELATGFAHEINNPLSIISLSSSLIRKNLVENRPDKNLLKSLDKIDNTVLRITKIINGLRNLSRLEEDNDFKQVTIQTMMEDAITLSQLKIYNGNIDLDVDFNQLQDHLITCNLVQIGQVLINLITNSIHAIEDQEKPWIKISIDEQEEHFTLSVMDSGTGIPEEIRDQIFDPMFTTKEIGKGTGIGLSLSKSIIEKHQGEISIDKTSQNTCFVIKLPKKAKEISAA